MKKVFVVPNRYMDSVMLMGVAMKLEGRADVRAAN